MRFFKKTDLIIITIIIALAFGVLLIQDLFMKEEGIQAEIYYYKELIELVDLEADKGKEIIVPQNNNVVIKVDEEGNIAFVSSDCPDKICIKTGKLHRVGEYAACLPNGVIVKIVKKGGRSSEDADIIVE